MEERLGIAVKRAMLAPERFAPGASGFSVPAVFRGAEGAAARQALIVLHGARRDCIEYADIATDAFGDRLGTLALAVPQFPIAADLAGVEDAARLARWPDRIWIEGGAAVAPAGLDAFSVLDALIGHFSDRTTYPLVSEIVIAGHSAGGQLAHRHAVLSPLGDAVRYVVANPASYVWFGPAAGPWKYGLAGRPAYGGALDDAAIEARYARRDVVYLLGRRDCDPEHRMLDRTPPALAQGPHRLARGRNYIAHLAARQGAALRHRLIEIEGVGHDPGALFAAAAARDAVLGAARNNQEEETR
ncbi:MAG: hypothetical protein KJS79_11615 [Rhodospirillales bacterium]|nr:MULTISPECIES: hypothetical protein [Acidiphilium]MBU6357369.1 hypothetical protein [Rhodospirillales bacterium]MDE2326770.1 hypothetical protein [Rhodospirillales bacterium]UNC14364.1 hypothetical protein FE249_09120 [Acidiphilium multivorum]